uniref:Uncharacterized protein n=1 Tax=Pipistrellus kuhlii TaxID=59472 RepID=A0A7J7WLW7_PIPKU|nr:hypothetical protein mPipKuh1_007968 [Pipistrellus kuhlii]
MGGRREECKRLKAIIMPLLHWRKLRHRESHTASKWQRQDEDSDSQAQNPLASPLHTLHFNRESKGPGLYTNSTCLCLGLLVTTRKQAPQGSTVVLPNLPTSEHHPITTHRRKQALFQARVDVRYGL